MILKQKASPKYWCLNIHDISLCIKPALCTVLSAIHILTGCETTSKVGTKLCAFKPTAVHLLSEFGKSLSSPIPFKMKSYAKLSNNLLKYSNPTEHVLLWRILGMKYIIKVRFDLHLHFLRCTTYIQTHWLQNETVDPISYGYEDQNGSLVPTYHINNVSESLVQKCSCKCAHINTVHAEVLMFLHARIQEFLSGGGGGPS